MGLVRFLHTGDWQLGMTRWFLGEEARGRFAEARIEAIRALGNVAREHDCAFIAVCGDVFESNHVDRRTVVRAASAMAEVGLPCVLLPGNHDPLDAASVFDSEVFRDVASDRIHVLRDTKPLSLGPGVEVVGAPWSNKHPGRDLVAELCAELTACPAGVTRIALAHGAIDLLSPNDRDPARIALSGVETALRDGRLHYLALGDRHSLTAVGDTGRIFYAGAPEPTDWTEVLPGRVLVVTLDGEQVETTEHCVASWRFVRHGPVALGGSADLDALSDWIDGAPDKSRSVLRLELEGTLDLAAAARLGALVEHARDLFAGVVLRDENLAVHPEDTDFELLALSGFAAASVERLRAASADGPDAEAARDALALLVRLAGTEGQTAEPAQ